MSLHVRLGSGTFDKQTEGPVSLAKVPRGQAVDVALKPPRHFMPFGHALPGLQPLQPLKHSNIGALIIRIGFWAPIILQL